jgi:hypothetical protein
MGSWLNKSRRWPTLLLALVIALLALSGGTPLRAEAQTSTGKMNVGWNPRTPPVGPGMICKGQNLSILATPYAVIGPEVFPNMFHAHRASVTVTPARVGTIIPPLFTLRSLGGPAVFIYNSDKTGQESLLFTATMPRPVTITDTNATTGSSTVVTVERAGQQFNFEVTECQYKVTLVYNWQANIGGVGYVQFGIKAQTRLVRNPDGIFEGTVPPFKFTQVLTGLDDCTASLTEMEIPVRITGKFDAPGPSTPSGILKLTFEYGTGTMNIDVKCPEAKGSGGQTFDLSSSNETVEFPGGHPSTKRAAKAPPGTRLTITVEPETIGTQ